MARPHTRTGRPAGCPRSSHQLELRPSAAGVFEPDGDEVDGAAEFDFGLRRILDGVDALLPSRS
ncbi:hypothetical protein [Micromonospora sp. NPDC049679]|uniref:hypothetical protein n=1 Tax=Micromonospora sp. NPDC049679 TaxID=3155920 RepID=UPI0033DB86BA